MPGSARIVIVGGGPAAQAAAAAYREAGGDAPVLMLTDDDRPPYRRPPLSKELLRGEAGEDELPLADAAWYRDAAIEVRCATAVAHVDPAAREVRTRAGESIAYRACLVATGSEPVRPPIPGVGLPGVHVLRTARDSLALRAAVGAGTGVVVVGAGFVGCEAAASLAMGGARVALVTEGPPQTGRLGPDVAARLAAWLAELGVTVRTGRRATAITPEGAALRVELGDDATHAQRVLLATGAHPRGVPGAPAEIARDGGAVVTDASMATSAPGVWCAGDGALAMNTAAGRRLRAEHWGEALAQGAVAGRAMAGRGAEWDGVPGFWSTIGRRTLKQAAWGDGWDAAEVRDHGDGAFTAWYGRRGRVVGVLTHGRDGDYDLGTRLVRDGAAWPPP